MDRNTLVLLVMKIEDFIQRGRDIWGEINFHLPCREIPEETAKMVSKRFKRGIIDFEAVEFRLKGLLDAEVSPELPNECKKHQSPPFDENQLFLGEAFPEPLETNEPEEIMTQSERDLVKNQFACFEKEPVSSHCRKIECVYIPFCEKGKGRNKHGLRYLTGNDFSE